MSSQPAVLPLIAVYGSTGQQGSSILSELCKHPDEFRIRALTRDTKSSKARALAEKYPNIELVAVSLKDESSLVSAFSGCSGAYLLSWPFGSAGTVASEVSDTKIVVDAACSAGVTHIIYGSVIGARDKINVPTFETKGEIENYLIEKCDDTQTNLKYINFLRFSGYMQNFASTEFGINPMNGRMSVLMDPNIKVPLCNQEEFGLIVYQVFKNPNMHAKWKDNYCDVISGFWSHQEVCDVMNKYLEFVQKDETQALIAFNALKEMYGMDVLIRMMSVQFDDACLMFEWFEKGFQSKQGVTTSRDILNDAGVEMITLDSFIKERFVTNEKIVEMAEKQKKTSSVYNSVLSVLGVASLGVAAYAGYSYYVQKSKTKQSK